MKKERFKVCSNCRYIVEEKTTKCPVCGSRDFSKKWKGELIIFDLTSEVARALNITKEGRYAIQVL